MGNTCKFHELWLFLAINQCDANSDPPTKWRKQDGAEYGSRVASFSYALFLFIFCFTC